MNEQLQQTVNEILTRSIEAFNQGADWMAGQIPDVVEQLLMFHAVEALAYAIANTAVVVFVTIAYYKLVTHKKFDFSEPEWVFSSLFGGLFALLALIVCAIDAIKNVMIALKIWIAPKLYLLEYAADLVK